MTRIRNVTPEAICGSCGRVEVPGAYCTYCLASPFDGIEKPLRVDIYAVRHALVTLHGWKSPNLCFEITRGRARLIDDAREAGFLWTWPRAPKGADAIGWRRT